MKKELLIEFGTWVQDNYSQNAKQGSKEMLPKGTMRKDFTDDHYSMEEILDEFLSRTSVVINDVKQEVKDRNPFKYWKRISR
jgi:hypothetical protein